MARLVDLLACNLPSNELETLFGKFGNTTSVEKTLHAHICCAILFWAQAQQLEAATEGPVQEARVHARAGASGGAVAAAAVATAAGAVMLILQRWMQKERAS